MAASLNPSPPEAIGVNEKRGKLMRGRGRGRLNQVFNKQQVVRGTHTENSVSEAKHITTLLIKMEIVAGVSIDLMEGLSSESSVAETVRVEEIDSVSADGETVPYVGELPIGFLFDASVYDII